MRTQSVFVLLYATLICASQAAALEVEDIARAARSNDLKTFTQLNTDLTDKAGYRQAYLGYAHAIALQAHGADREAKDALKTSVDVLHDLVATESEVAENWILLSAAYGLQMGFSPFKGPLLGPKSTSAIQKALELEPDNPRAHMFHGVSLYHTPSFFGGDKQKAIRSFSHAIALFGARKPSGWGASQAYIWRAIAYHDADEVGLALADLDSALAMHPDYAWAQKLRASISGTNDAK